MFSNRRYTINIWYTFNCSTLKPFFVRLEVENRPSEEQLAEKTASEKENRRNMKQQVYTSSPMKCDKQLRDDASGMYEISPYATFSVTGNNRAVTTSSLDYTMQFKTFGHIEEVENYPKMRSGKHSWHKSQRYYNNEGKY